MAKHDDLDPRPNPGEFKLSSQWFYAMSSWYESQDKLKQANLYMQRARYHQEKEFWDQFQSTRARPAPLRRRDLRPGSAANSVEHGVPPDQPTDEQLQDAAAIARVFYSRSRAISPLKSEMPIWDELKPNHRKTLIEHGLEAIRLIDNRNANRKAMKS